jgi:DNA helicase HerA-like ATPase
MTHYTIDNGAIHVLGRTQTGKTVFSKQIHAETPRISIWVNRTGTDRIPGVSGKVVRGIDAIESGIANGRDTFNYLSSSPSSDIPELVDWVWEVADLNDREVEFQLTIDEVHEHAPQSQKKDLEPRDTIRRVAKRGMKRGVKLVSITQDPVAMDKQTLRQREYLAVFELAAEQFSYMTDYGVGREVNDLEEFAAMVYNAKGQAVDEAVKGASKYA